MIDDFDTKVQVEEIIPEEYEDWLCFCAGTYDHFEEEDEDDCFKPGRPFVSIFELNL